MQADKTEAVTKPTAHFFNIFKLQENKVNKGS